MATERATSQYNLVLSNTTASAISAEVVVGTRPGIHIQLKPHETATADLSPSIEVAKSVPIEVRSSSGMVAGTAFISDTTTGFSSSVDFLPRDKDHRIELHASYVPIGLQPNTSGIGDAVSLNCVVLLHNPTAVEARVDIQLQSTVAGSQQVRAVPTRRLSPGATATLALPDFWHGNSGPIGMTLVSDHAITAKAIPTDHGADLTFEIPIVDPSRVTSSFANPWRVNKSESSILALTNPSDDVNSVSIHIRYSHGDYNIGRTLAPGETTLINVGQLGDDHVPDSHGFLLPADVEDGFIAWSSLRGRGRLIGRTIVHDLQNGVSTTYSCGTCNCPPGLVYITTPVNVLNGVVDGPPQVLPVTAVYDDGYAEDITLGAICDGYDRRAEAVAEELVFFGSPGWDQISISVFGWRYMCYWDDFMCDDGSRGDCNGQCIENSTPVSAQIYVYTHGSECTDDRDEMILEYFNLQRT